MTKTITSTIHGVIDMSWPMVIISMVVLVTLRITYLIKRKEHIYLYKEILALTFVIYILCLFQVVTFQDDASWATNNFVPFKEIMRYSFGSKLFIKNVFGNMIMFIPYGFFVSYILKNKTPWLTLILALITCVTIELVQMSIGRVFDVDDMILNMVGGYFGYLIYYMLSKIGEKKPKLCNNEIFLDIMSIIMLGSIIAIIIEII